MKKNLFYVLMVVGICLSTITVRASHMMGGQITLAPSTYGGLTYVLTYTAYRDTVGIPIATTANITFTDSVSGVTFVRSFTYDSANVIMLVPGVEQYTYSDSVTFPNAGNWFISYEECCRNAALLNMTPGCHYFYANVMVDSLNASPEFLNPPIILAQEAVPFYYNPLPFDANADSIAWLLDIPLDCMGVPSSNYVLPSSDSLVPFNMDPITGEITFLPNLVGNFQVSVRVLEYRNGVLIGDISRDMQIIVVPSANTPSNLILNANVNPSGNKTYTVAPGANLNMTLNLYDQDMQNTTINASGEAFMLANNPAQFTVTNGVGSATLNFNWTPDASQARENPYFTTFRVSEVFGLYVFQSDVTISMRVGNFTTGLNAATAENSLSVTPNPARDFAMLQFESASTEKAVINILSQDGKLVKTIDQSLNAAGIQVVKISTSEFAKGLYIMSVVQGGKSLGVTRLIIAE